MDSDSNETIISNNPNQTTDTTADFSDSDLIVRAAATTAESTDTLQQTMDILAVFNNYQFESNKVFSYAEWISAADIDVQSATAHSLAASLLYELSVRTGMETGERFTHLKIPSYIKPGFDVQIAKGSKNLTLRNPYRFAIRVSTGTESNIPYLRVATNSSKAVKFPTIEVNEQTIPFEKVLISKKRSSASKELSQAGVNGSIVKVHRILAGNKKEIVSRDYYPSRPQYILKSAASTESDDVEFEFLPE